MKRVFFFIIIITSLFIIKNFVVSIYSLWQKQELISQTQKELETEKKKNKKLKEDLAQAQSPQFLEETARNKLFLIKEGEQEVIIPKYLLQKQEERRINTNDPNWKQWFSLFF